MPHNARTGSGIEAKTEDLTENTKYKERMYSSLMPKILTAAQDFLEGSVIAEGLTQFKVVPSTAETAVYPEL